MFLAVDVHYRVNRAVTAGVLFDRWSASEPVRELVTPISGVAAYEPGRFFERELPCILALLRCLPELPEIIIVDGYVDLGHKRQPGLGRHLYQALKGQAAVIGVAKRPFKSTPAAAAIYRGRSGRPLYVTAAGISPDYARHCIVQMHGRWRIPTLLKRVDHLCRQFSVS
jgi:deoxyribonuclease V